MADAPAAIHLVLTADQSVAHRMDTWRDTMRLVGELRVPAPSTFAAEFASSGVGEMRSVRVAASTFGVARDHTVGVPVAREHVIFNLVEQGMMRGHIAGRRIAAAAGDLLLSRTTNSLDLLMEDATWFGLLIPRTVFERHLQWSARYDGRVFRSGSAQAVLLGGMLRSISSLPEQLPQREIDRALTGVLALIGACFDFAPAAGGRESQGEITAQAIRRFIARQLADPALDVTTICREFGLSRASLYRVMGETGSVAALIRHLRLEGAANELVSSTANVAEIARRWGFRDERTFRRAFQRTFARSPSTVRNDGNGGKLLGPVSSDLQRWFRGSV